MKQRLRFPKAIVRWLIICLLTANTLFSLSGQTPNFDTLYQSENMLLWLNYSHDYTYWYEIENDDVVIYRLFEGTLDSVMLPEAYQDCTSFTRIYAYKDFLYVRIGSALGTTACDQGFIWEGDELIPDPYDLVYVDATREHLFLLKDLILFDVITKTKKTLTLPQDQYRHSNIFSIQGPVVYIKAFKYDASNQYIGDALIQYYWEDDVFTELFFSPEFLHFPDKYFKDDRIGFTVAEYNNPSDVPDIYYYDGEDVHFVGANFDINGQVFSYMDGMAYAADDGLYYWENGREAYLSDDVFHLAVDDCKLFWFTGRRPNSEMNIFNGSGYIKIPIPGYPEEITMHLISEDDFIIVVLNTERTHNVLLRGTHGVNCPDCETQDVQIPADDQGSYLRTNSITSEAVIYWGDAIYKAEESIRLEPGFRVANDAQFLAEIVACPDELSLEGAGDEMTPRTRLSAAGTTTAVQTMRSGTLPEISQNEPNPFRRTTSIKYFIPETSRVAKLSIFNLVGKRMREIDIDALGAGRLTLSMDDLPDGVYHYALIVDGVLIDTKKMVLMK